MNPKVKKKWVEKLRSGEYEQTTARLRGEDNKRCCLGVLCDLYNDEHEKSYWDGSIFHAKSDQGESTLPLPVMEWAGLENDSGDFVEIENEDGQPTDLTLADLNDGHGMSGVEPRSFDEIADVIEKQL